MVEVIQICMPIKYPLKDVHFISTSYSTLQNKLNFKWLNQSFYYLMIAIVYIFISIVCLVYTKHKSILFVRECL